LIHFLRFTVITMMYGFGDDENPLAETVDLTEVSNDESCFMFAKVSQLANRVVILLRPLPKSPGTCY